MSHARPAQGAGHLVPERWCDDLKPPRDKAQAPPLAARPAAALVVV